MMGTHSLCNRGVQGLVVLTTLVFVIESAFTMQHAAAETALPARTGPPAETTQGVPHQQIGAEAIPALNTELLRRVALLPGVDIRPTIIGMWGAQGFWLLEDLELTRPTVIFNGREFAHLHPDGSLHASLPTDRAYEAVATGWATRHPSAQYHERLEGFVMLHTPRSAAEMNLVFGLVVDGYNFITGQDIQAEEIR